MRVAEHVSMSGLLHIPDILYFILTAQQPPLAKCTAQLELYMFVHSTIAAHS